MNKKKQKKNNVPIKSKRVIKAVTIIWCITILLSASLFYVLRFFGIAILSLTLIFGVGLLITAYNECTKSNKKACLGMIANCIFAATIMLAIGTLVIFPGTIYFLADQPNGIASGTILIVIYVYGTPIISVIVAAAAVFKAKVNENKSFF